MKEAPLFTQTYDFHRWILERLEKTSAFPAVRQAVIEHSRGLLEAVILALGRGDARAQLLAADQHLALLRVHLRLAAETELLADQQLLHANQLLRDVGRQIGGWSKRQGAPGAALA